MKRLLLLGLVMVAMPAFAARPFAVTDTAAIQSEDSVAFESWLDWGHPTAEASPHAIVWWLGARVGLSKHFELSGFVLFEGVSEAAPRSAFVQAIAEAKYSFVPAYEDGFHPFLRLQLIDWPQDYPPFQARLTAGVDRSFGKLTVAANASYWDSNEFERDDNKTWHRWPWLEGELAASYALIAEEGVPPALTMGGEAWAMANLPVPTGQTNSVVMPWSFGHGVFLGPTVSATKGRLSATAHVSVGVPGIAEQKSVVTMMRLIISVAL